MAEEKDFERNKRKDARDDAEKARAPEELPDEPGIEQRQQPEDVPDVGPEDETPDREEAASAETREHEAISPVVTQQDRFLAALSHFCIVALLPAIQVPLLIWLLEKDKATRSEFVVFNAKQACVYQLFVLATMAILYMTVVLYPVANLVGLASGIYGIVAGVKTAKGQEFSYYKIGEIVRNWK